MKRALKLLTKPYGYIVLVKECDAVAANKWLKRAGCSDDMSDSRGAVWGGEDHTIYLWLETDFEFITLCHELIHVVFIVLRGSGVPVTVANDEAVTYLHEHLLLEAMKKLGLRVVRDLKNSGVAQLAERLPVKGENVGSTPTPGAKLPPEAESAASPHS